MTGRPPPGPSEPGRALPVLDRIAPAPPQSLVVSLIDGHTGAGDIVADPFGRGGWIARAGLDRQRRVVSLESSPLTRMLAEVVLRPPDVRHLDAAFQGIAASPRREIEPQGIARRHVRDPLRDVRPDPRRRRGRVGDRGRWRGGAPHRQALPLHRCVATSAAAGSNARASSMPKTLTGPRPTSAAAAVRRELAERFPPIDGAPDLVDELLDLHSPRQLVGLAAIMARVEGDLRAAPVLAALRLAVLHAILPASRLTRAGRTAPCASPAGHVRLPGSAPGGSAIRGSPSRTASGWSAASSRTRGRSRRGRSPRGSARTCAALARGPRPRCSGSPVPAVSGHSGWMAGIRVAAAARASASSSPSRRSGPRSTGWPPRTTARRGCSGARPRRSSRPDALAGASLRPRGAGRPRRSAEPSSRSRPPWPATAARCSWSTAGRRRSCRLSSAASSAGFRLVTAQLGDADDDTGLVELVPPNAVLPPGPRTRANVALEPVPGGAGDPDLVPGPGLFAAPERFDQRPFSAAEAARKVSETAVEMLKARGEPARYERLLPEILVGLDRGGMLRRYTTTVSGDADEAVEPGAGATSDEPTEPGVATAGSAAGDASTSQEAEPGPRTAPVTHGSRPRG